VVRFCHDLFSIPPSKLAGYILPVVAPLTILITAWVQQTLTLPKNKLQIFGVSIFVSLMGLAILVAPHVMKTNHDFYFQHIGLISLLGAILTASPWVFLACYKAKRSLFYKRQYLVYWCYVQVFLLQFDCSIRKPILTSYNFSNIYMVIRS
jgi:4-amino-4-deoxy-L-arabinose transferase-like glycosyltransferase